MGNTENEVLGPWRLLSDKALDRRADDRFGLHSVYAELLLGVARKCQTPFTIGLYSGWGTGKTSIANLIRESAKSDGSISVVYLDVWKYSSDPLKRWILLETCRQLKEEGVLKDSTFKGRTLESYLEFEEEWDDEAKVEVDRGALRNILLVSVLFALGAMIVARLVPEPLQIPVAWAAGAGFLAYVFQAFVKKIYETLGGLIFKRTIKHVTAKPAFSSEKFGSLFRELISKAVKEGNCRRLVFVFDNLDRCQESVAADAVSVIKSYLDEQHCVYVIPCDDRALMRHIAKSYTGSSEKNESEKYAREFLNKFFQMTIRLPAPVEFDIEKYVDSQLEMANMNDLPAEARDVLVLGYRGETPRDVKRIVNDLIGFRSLAIQAETRKLVEPGALTSDLPMLTKMCVISVKWPEFMDSLAEDPDLWDEVMEKVRTGSGTGTKEVSHELTVFLRSTKTVSPTADVRPFLYLKRADFEKDVALKKRVEEALRTADEKEFVEMISSDELKQKRETIVRLSIAAARNWLSANRFIQYKNCAPLLVVASVRMPKDRDLRVAALSVAEQTVLGVAPDTVDRIFRMEHLLELTASADADTRSTILGKLTDLFDPSNPINNQRYETLRLLLANHDHMGVALRNKVRKHLGKRYLDGKDRIEVLKLLNFAAETPPAMSWCVQPETFAAIAQDLEFSDDSADQMRMNILVSFQRNVPEAAKEAFFGKVSSAISVPAGSAVNTQVRNVLRALVRFDAEVLGEEAASAIGTEITKQIAAQPDMAQKGEWLGTLLHLYGLANAKTRQGIDQTLGNILTDPTDPLGLQKLLDKLGPRGCERVLDVEAARVALRNQPSKLQARFGVGTAPKHRKDILSFIPGKRLLHEFDLFDDSLSWDLGVYCEIAQSGPSDEQIGIEELRSCLSEFCRRFVTGKLPANMAVFEKLQAVVDSAEDLLDETMAELLVSCAVESLEEHFEAHYDVFKRYSNELSTARRNELVKDVVKKFLQPSGGKERLLVLVAIAGDVLEDEDLRGDVTLVGQLMDFAFEETRRDSTNNEIPLLELAAYLEPSARSGYVGRALEVSLGLESVGRGTEDMEGFLKLMAGNKVELERDHLAMAGQLVKRLLSPAKPLEDKIRIVSFLREVGSAKLVQSTSAELRATAESDDEALSEGAKALLLGK